ncbi:hypothetical protein [Mycobacterium sp. ITM-2016-00318]|uniref:hypothetical protein n=1 Tax=Mycobacterium sp. ITM-2016-00318 TaxID=2099693 RepID=UPI00115ABC51
MRSAIGTAMACGAFVTGPMCVGVAVSHADLLGGGGGVDVLGVDLLGGDKKEGGAAGTLARANGVSTAPSTRSVVIRSKAAAPQQSPSIQPVVAPASMRTVAAETMGAPLLETVPSAPPPAASPPMPAAVPVSVMPPAAPAVDVPAPQAAPITTTNQPRPSARLGRADGFSPKSKLPNTFRVGYAEYLRTATTSDILAAALPGAAGLAGFTILGAYAGYRQAKALQEALLAPVPTSILL